MSDSTVFRNRGEPQKEEELPKGRPSQQTVTHLEDPPLIGYRAEKGSPFVVDHFQLGEYWNDPSASWESEVSAIEGYLSDLVEKGEIENSTKAARAEIKRIEKLTGIDKEARTAIKVATLAEYVQFIRKAGDIKRNITRYGNQ